MPRTSTYGIAKKSARPWKASGSATAMKNATAVASSVAAAMAGWVVSAALSAQVNCVQAHHTSQKISTPSPTAAQLTPS